MYFDQTHCRAWLRKVEPMTETSSLMLDLKENVNLSMEHIYDWVHLLQASLRRIRRTWCTGWPTERRDPPHPAPLQYWRRWRNQRKITRIDSLNVSGSSEIFKILSFSIFSVEDEVVERKQFLEEMSKVGLSRKLKREVEGEIGLCFDWSLVMNTDRWLVVSADKLREMKLLQRNREKQINTLERVKINSQ